MKLRQNDIQDIRQEMFREGIKPLIVDLKELIELILHEGANSDLGDMGQVSFSMIEEAYKEMME